MANVVLRPPVREHELTLASASPGSAEPVPLHELVVGVDEGRFYLRWPAQDARVEVCSGHMLNTARASHLVRFLIDASSDGIAPLRGFSWGSAGSLPALPRVVAGRCVLRPAQWLLPDAAMPGAPSVTRDRLWRWAARWGVPRYVCAGTGDNQLLLDLSDGEQLDELARQMTERARSGARGRLAVREHLPRLDDCWVPGPTGRHAHELVVSMMLRSGIREPRRPPAARRKLRPVIGTAAGRQVRPPGSDWLFLKLYTTTNQEEQILRDAVPQLVDCLAEADLTAWFFIRYNDPDRHLRLRFAGAPERLTHVAYPTVVDWARELLGSGCVTRYAFDSYEREVQRYGGSRALDQAERIFAADSAFVVRVLGLADGETPRLPLAAVTTSALLAALGVPRPRQVEWLRGAFPASLPGGDEYRRYKSRLRRELLSGSESPALAALLDRLSEALREPADRLRELDGREELTAPVDGIVRSVVHMHANRLLRASEREDALLGLLARTLAGLDLVQDTTAAPRSSVARSARRRRVDHGA